MHGGPCLLRDGIIELQSADRPHHFASLRGNGIVVVLVVLVLVVLHPLLHHRASLQLKQGPTFLIVCPMQ